MKVVTELGGTVVVGVSLLLLVGWQLSRHCTVDAVFSVAVVVGGHPRFDADQTSVAEGASFGGGCVDPPAHVV